MFSLLERLTAGESFRLGIALVLFLALVVSVLWDRAGKRRGAAAGEREAPGDAASCARGEAPAVETEGDIDPDELAAVIAAALAALGPGRKAARLTVRPFDQRGGGAWRAAGGPRVFP